MLNVKPKLLLYEAKLKDYIEEEWSQEEHHEKPVVRFIGSVKRAQPS
ncbi:MULTISPECIES: hypothetical protein [Pyrococcus]|nr:MULTISPECIES: hypothetical protein [Pyrococcus]MDK2870572.1 hypothetical protein [Pyrococcus sp.]